jgi:hypothetical protein
MTGKNQPAKRNRLDFVRPGTKSGDVVSIALLPPEFVTELRDNPDDFGKPLQVGRILPGVRATLELSGCPFTFMVRVVTDGGGTPQLVDLRVRSPIDCGDVAITNADLKAVSVATLIDAAMSPPVPGVRNASAEPDPAAHVARRPGRPTQLTDAFLRDVTRLARQAWREEAEDINLYVAAAMLAEGKIGHHAYPETVRGWRKAAAKRRKKPPPGQPEDDDSFLLAGELRGKPPTTHSANKNKDDR